MTRLPYRALYLALLLTSALCQGGAAATAPASLTVPSAGKQIRVDLYPAARAKPLGTILVLHGAGGTLFDGPEMRRVAQQLAAAGETVYLLHYFNRTGTIAITRDSIMQYHFDDWQATVRDAIRWVRGREGKRPIGIYGYSLGAFLAVAAASDNPAVGAITEQAGGIWNSQEQRVGKMPPVFMVHGRADQRVPFAKYAVPLRRVLNERGAKVQTHFFAGEGHVFSPAGMRVVRPEVVKFFARELP